MLPRYGGAIDTVQSLSDQPNQTDGFTPAQLKLKFDQGTIDAKTYADLLVVAIELQYATKTEVNQVVAGQVSTLDPVTGKKYVFSVTNSNPGITEVA